MNMNMNMNMNMDGVRENMIMSLEKINFNVRYTAVLLNSIEEYNIEYCIE